MAGYYLHLYTDGELLPGAERIYAVDDNVVRAEAVRNIRDIAADDICSGIAVRLSDYIEVCDAANRPISRIYFRDVLKIADS